MLPLRVSQRPPYDAWRRRPGVDAGCWRERVQVEQKIAEQFRALGLGEPDFAAPPADFNVAMSGAHVLPGALVGNVAYITAIPSIKERWYSQGRLGDDLTVDQGYRAAQLAALSALVELKHV